MASVTSSIQIPSSPQAVWAVVSDPSRLPQWQSNHVGFAGGTPTDLAVGSSYTQQVKVMGMPAEVAWTVETAQAPDAGPGRLEQSGQGPMGIGVRTTAVVEAAGDGSLVTLTQEFSGAAVMMVGAQLEKEVSGVQQDDLESLKALLAV